MSTTALEISCAKPDCHWRGSPADAPTHPCPTPAEAELPTDPFAGMEQQTGGTIPALSVEDEPETREQIELWLTEHGDYTETGVPNDEKTARLDAKFAAMPEPEPPIDEIDETLEGEPIPDASDSAPSDEGPKDEPIEEGEIDLLGSGEIVETPPSPTPAEGPRAWQSVIKAELEEQTGVAEMRWLVILKPANETEEASLIGRGRIKSDAQEIADKVAERAEVQGELMVVKTAAVIEEALEIEKRRENVETEEPETVEETPPAEETEPEEKTAQEAAAEAQAAAEAAEEGPEEEGGQKTLIDRSAFESEDLAIAKVDGKGIDRIAIGFSGRIMLDRSDKHDVALYRRLELGKEVELRVAGRVTGTGAKGQTNKGGDLDVVVGEKVISIGTVYVLTPEEL